MDMPFHYLLVVIFLAIVLDYYFVRSLQKEKDNKHPIKESKTGGVPNLRRFFGIIFKNSDGLTTSFLRRFLNLPIFYIFMLISAGIVLLKGNLWESGTVCIVIGMVGFALINNTDDDSKEASPSFQNNFNGSSYLQNVYAGQDKKTATNSKNFLWVIPLSLLAFSIFTTLDNSGKTSLKLAGAAAWIGSVLIGVTIVFWQKVISVRDFFGTIRNNRYEFRIFALIFVLGLFLRVFLLSSHPYPWSGDEGSIGLEATRYIKGQASNFFEARWSLEPGWSFVPTAASIKIFGENIPAVRVPSALAGALAVLFTYLAAREMFNPTIALLSSAFLASFPLNVHFSRLGVHNVMDSLMSSLVFWLIARSVKTENPGLGYLAGVLGGFCIYTYAGTKLVPFLGMIILLVFLYKKKDLKIGMHYVVPFLAAIFISATPQIVSSLHHGNTLTGRLNQELVFSNGWLAEQVSLTGEPAIKIILTQLGQTLLAFISLPTQFMFYNSPKPYLTFLGSVFFLFGLGYTVSRKSKPEFLTLLIWFSAVVMLGGALTMNPPASTRLLMTTPVASMLIGIGIYRTIEYLKGVDFLSARNTNIATVILIGLLSFQNIYFYMIEYRNNTYFQDFPTEFAMEVGIMTKGLGEDYQIFIMGYPVAHSDFPTLLFLAPENHITDLWENQIPELSLAENQKYAFFAIPDNQDKLDRVMEMYKGGETGTFYRKGEPKTVLFEYYLVEVK